MEKVKKKITGIVTTGCSSKQSAVTSRQFLECKSPSPDYTANHFQTAITVAFDPDVELE